MKIFIWIVLLEIPTCEPATWQRAARSSIDSPFGGGHPRPWCQGQRICFKGLFQFSFLIILWSNITIHTSVGGAQAASMVTESGKLPWGVLVLKLLSPAQQCLGEWDIWVGGGLPHLKMVGVYLYCPHGAWKSQYGKVTFGGGRFWCWHYWLSTWLQLMF